MHYNSPSYVFFQPSILQNLLFSELMANITMCTLLFSSNELGSPEDPYILLKESINDGPTKSLKLLSVLFDEYLSFDPHISIKFALKSQSLSSASIQKNLPYRY